MRHKWRFATTILIAFAVTAVLTFRARSAVVPSPGEQTAYVKPEVCASCHTDIWKTYRQTGMARSFYRPRPNATDENCTNKTFYHQASDSYFTMFWRDGKLRQRRYQLDPDGKQTNLMEKQVDYVLGSGNHARTYLNRTSANQLIELPLGWYAEKGGSCAMNPGYDRPDHDGFRRPITYDCMFCHNAYPSIPVEHAGMFAEPVYSDPLPQGIDCQRCHGPGRNHVQLASTAGSKADDLRKAIINPARLSPQRQMELCMVCHLETTSFPLPNSIQRYDRGPFSYKPGEPMASFLMTFDHAPGSGRENKFEFVSAAYRLRRSACFLESRNRLLCSTCHNPHDIPHGERATAHYNEVCRQCHASSFDQLIASGKHVRSADCIGCHMPKRRTEDVVHAVVTDHYIQRRKPDGDPLAEMPERHESGASAYRGRVALYYPETLPQTPENELLLATAQVNQRSNLQEGIAQLTAAIERYSPTRPEYYFELAEAWRENGDLAKAIPLYRKSLQRDAGFVPAMQKLGFTLRRSRQYPEALAILNRAVLVAPENASLWLELGLTYQSRGNQAGATAAFAKAATLDPDIPEAHNNLGILWSLTGQSARAESAFREAIRIQPNYADAHSNLGNLLSNTGVLREALYHFDLSLRARPDDAATRYNYALALGRARRFNDAQYELESALRIDPNLADAHEVLGDLLTAKGQLQAALPHYREAVRIEPESGKAHLRLASALIPLGDLQAAISHLQKAARDPDPNIRGEAEQLLRQVTKEY